MSFPHAPFPFVRRDTELVRACNERLRSRGNYGMEMLLDTKHGHFVVVRWDGVPRRPFPLVAFTKPVADRRHEGDFFCEVSPDVMVRELGKVMDLQRHALEATLESTMDAEAAANKKHLNDAHAAWYDGEHDKMDATVTESRKRLGDCFGSCETDGTGPNYGSKFYGPQFDRNVVNR